MRRIAIATLTVALFIATAPAIASASVPGLPFTETACQSDSDSVARLYTAGLDRKPEEAGFNFWLDGYTSGVWSLPRMANFFADSPEFKSNYGELDQRGFITQVYKNVLNRDPEAEGLNFWDGQMTNGMTRGTLLLRFSESPENVVRSGTVASTLGPYNSGRVGPWTCGSGFPPGNPGDSKNCDDFRTQAEAQAWFDHYFPAYGDIAKLDRDNNGRACESLP